MTPMRAVMFSKGASRSRESELSGPTFTKCTLPLLFLTLVRSELRHLSALCTRLLSAIQRPDIMPISPPAVLSGADKTDPVNDERLQVMALRKLSAAWFLSDRYALRPI